MGRRPFDLRLVQVWLTPEQKGDLERLAIYSESTLSCLVALLVEREVIRRSAPETRRAAAG